MDDVKVTMKHGLLRIAFPKAKRRTEPLSGTRITVLASDE
jgi:HSP20 family molecular chaperone IbpA